MSNNATHAQHSELCIEQRVLYQKPVNDVHQLQLNQSKIEQNDVDKAIDERTHFSGPRGQ